MIELYSWYVIFLIFTNCYLAVIWSTFTLADTIIKVILTISSVIGIGELLLKYCVE